MQALCRLLSYRSYDSPCPSDEIIQDNVGRLTLAIDNCLRKGSSKNFSIHVNFRHDVYHHLFNNKTTLYRNDFCSRFFKEGWDQCYIDYSTVEEHNYGIRLSYPVYSRLYLRWMKAGHYKTGDGTINTKSRGFVEIVRFTLKKVNC